MPEYKHIKSLNDLDREIDLLKIKRELIKTEMSGRAERMKRQYLSPVKLGASLFSILFDKDISSPSKLVRSFTTILNDLEASKMWMKFLVRLFK